MPCSARVSRFRNSTSWTYDVPVFGVPTCTTTRRGRRGASCGTGSLTAASPSCAARRGGPAQTGVHDDPQDVVVTGSGREALEPGDDLHQVAVDRVAVGPEILGEPGGARAGPVPEPLGERQPRRGGVHGVEQRGAGAHGLVAPPARGADVEHGVDPAGDVDRGG